MTNKKKSKPKGKPDAAKKVEQPTQTKESPKKQQPATTAQTASTPAIKPATPETTPSNEDASRQPSRTQCYKCQRWGHMSYGCRNKTRCVRCSKEHRASECPKRADEPCCCSNCSGDHPSSYRGCPAAPKTRRRRRPRPRRKLEIPGIPQEKVTKFFKAAFKMMTLKDFLTETQLQAIALDSDDIAAAKDASCQTTPEIVSVTPSRSDEQTQTEPVEPPIALVPETPPSRPQLHKTPIPHCNSGISATQSETPQNMPMGDAEWYNKFLSSASSQAQYSFERDYKTISLCYHLRLLMSFYGSESKLARILSEASSAIQPLFQVIKKTNSSR